METRYALDVEIDGSIPSETAFAIAVRLAEQLSDMEKIVSSNLTYRTLQVWFNGRTVGCQSTNTSSTLVICSEIVGSLEGRTSMVSGKIRELTVEPELTGPRCSVAMPIQ